ncbi:TetR/AcrR family transcriptional regulator [Fulvivirga lutimaris]|uniref:TetR/AcrR family transcriptional regulator n=1 Tax=Fulvivirga lutimaris TaxID=1819566 RepID=UPI0012BB5080|nr:TetR/AcrR family transcriptional regulator [Fulvivirga lutimaris]MTI39952.1 TetR/AcrR family transcriptional regulator [Fulvivirga lutimaris]
MSIEEKIITGAGELFKKYGIRSVSMDDIARHLSISKKTIYQYYKDKDEIVSLSLKKHLEYEKQEYDQIFNNTSNAIEELVKVSKCMRQDFKDMKPSLIFDMQKYHPNAWKVWLSFKNEYIKNQVMENLKRGMAEGYFREDLNPDILARLRVELVQLAFDEDVFPADQYNLRDLQLQFFNHFVHGIVTEKGRKLYQKHIDSEISNQHK